MELNLLNIGINGASYEQVETALSTMLINEKFIDLQKIFKIQIDLEDYTEEYMYADNFLKAHNLPDETPFFNEFDMIPYGLSLGFFVKRDFKFLSILEPLVFVLAGELSKLLDAKCLVSFKKMAIPVALFDNGILIDTFEKYSEEFFKDKFWKPNNKFQ